MTTYLIVFASALVLAIGITPLARWLAPHVGLMDRPNARKIHAAPVPRVGGVAIFLAFIAAALVLGGTFLYYAVRMRFDENPRLPMRVFKYSINYLMLLFAALLLDHYFIVTFGL